VPRVVSFIVLVAILAFIAAMFFKVMAQFVLPLFLAAVFVVVFKPLHVWVRDRLPGSLRLSAIITTFLIMLVVLLPTAWLGWNAYLEGRTVFVYLKDDDNRKALEDKLTRAAQSVTDVVPFLDIYEKPSVDPLAASTTSPTTAEKPLQSQPSLDETAEADNQDDNISARSDDPDDATAEGPTVFESTLDGDDQHGSAAEPNLRLRVDALYDFAAGAIGGILIATAQGLVGVVLGLIIMVLAIYYFLVDGPTMINTMMRLSPLDNEYERELLDKFANVSRAVVVAVLAAAVVQGLLAGIGFYFALEPGAPIFLLMMVTMIASVIPFVGAAGIWIPTCIWVFLYQGERIVTGADGIQTTVTGEPMTAILLALYCGGVVSTIDNVIKPLVLHGQSNLHPLLALMSVLGGVKALGPVGILVGPMLVAFIHALLVMVNKELRLLSAGDVVDDQRQKMMFPLGPGDPSSPLGDESTGVEAAPAKPIGPLARVRNAAKNRKRKK
jgi:predicted PurR-regulated permease PerM